MLREARIQTEFVRSAIIGTRIEAEHGHGGMSKAARTGIRVVVVGMFGLGSARVPRRSVGRALQRRRKSGCTSRIDRGPPDACKDDTAAHFLVRQKVAWRRPLSPSREVPVTTGAAVVPGLQLTSA